MQAKHSDGLPTYFTCNAVISFYFKRCRYWQDSSLCRYNYRCQNVWRRKLHAEIGRYVCSSENLVTTCAEVWQGLKVSKFIARIGSDLHFTLVFVNKLSDCTSLRLSRRMLLRTLQWIRFGIKFMWTERNIGDGCFLIFMLPFQCRALLTGLTLPSHNQNFFR
jgi:hypothetical protein